MATYDELADEREVVEAGPQLRCPQCASILQDTGPASRHDGRWEGWCPTHSVVAGVDGDRDTILSRRGATVADMENVGKMLGGDGYDRMHWREQRFQFKPLASWGRDGWDLGDWPYVVISARLYEGKWEVLYDVEGDLTLTRHDTLEAFHAQLDELALFYWRLRPERHGMTDLPQIGPVPKKYTGPYRKDATQLEARHAD